MKFLLFSIRKDLFRWKQDVSAIVLWLCIPIMIGGLITSMMDGNDGGKPQGTLLIADLDDTLLSSLVSSAYSQGQLGEIILVEKISLEEGTAKIDAGKASGFLVIPKGFTSAFLQGVPVTLKLKTNPSETILPGIITEVTRVLLDAGFYIRQLFGTEIDQITDGDFSAEGNSAVVATVAIKVQEKLEKALPLFFPPAIELSIADPPADQPAVPLALLFMPGIILMALMLAANGLAGDLWRERENGTLRRLASTPGRLFDFIAGKAIAAGVIISAICLVALVIGFVYHGIDWSRLVSAMSWITLSGIAMFAWFGALRMMAGSHRAGNLLTSILLFPLLMVGGSFFPFAALPDWIASIGRRTPNGFIVDRLSIELTSITPWSIDVQSWLTLLLIAVSGLAVCTWRLQSGFARG